MKIVDLKAAIVGEHPEAGMLGDLNWLHALSLHSLVCPTAADGWSLNWTASGRTQTSDKIGQSYGN